MSNGSGGRSHEVGLPGGEWRASVTDCHNVVTLAYAGILEGRR